MDAIAAGSGCIGCSLLDDHAAAAAQTNPALQRKHITPHVLRHSCAVALLQSGTDVTVIRDYLDHASVATTGRYISTNLQMKRDAMQVTGTGTMTAWTAVMLALSFGATVGLSRVR